MFLLPTVINHNPTFLQSIPDYCFVLPGTKPIPQEAMFAFWANSIY